MKIVGMSLLILVLGHRYTWLTGRNFARLSSTLATPFFGTIRGILLSKDW